MKDADYEGGQEEQEEQFDLYDIQLFEQKSKDGARLNPSSPKRKGNVTKQKSHKVVEMNTINEIIRFDPNDQPNGQKTRDNISSSLMQQQLNFPKEEGGEQLFKKTQKVKKLQSEYKEHIETESALQKFQEKEYQFRSIIDHFMQLNILKEQQLLRTKSQLINISNTLQLPSAQQKGSLLAIYKNDHLNNEENNKKEEMADHLIKLRERIKIKEEKLREEQFCTKTLCHIESRLVIQKEDAQRMLLEYQELNEAVQKNIIYLEDDEKETKAQKTLNVCKQHYVKKAMNHIEDIHKTVMQKTMKLQEVAEVNLKSEIHNYKDIEESLTEAKEELKSTQQTIQQLVIQHQTKIKQQQELDSLIDHLADFYLLSKVFIKDDPKQHFTNQLSFEPQIDFSELGESADTPMTAVTVAAVTQKKLLLEQEEVFQPYNYHDDDDDDNDEDDKNYMESPLINVAQKKFTEMILKQKNLILFATKNKKKLTEIKNSIEDDEGKAQFIVNAINQFYEQNDNDIPGLFTVFVNSFHSSCRLRDNLSSKIVELEFDKKKLIEELASISKLSQNLKRKCDEQKKFINIKSEQIEAISDSVSFNYLFTQYFVNVDFITEYLSKGNEKSLSSHPPVDIYEFLEKHSDKQQTNFIHQEQEDLSKAYNTFLYSSNTMLMKFFSLLNQIRDRGDGLNSELNETVEESLQFLRGWSVQSKELDCVDKNLLLAELREVNISYVTSNIMSQKLILECLCLQQGGDTIFGVMKIFDRIFKEKHTLKQICERIIAKEEKKQETVHKNNQNNVREQIESVYYEASNWNLKRSRECLKKMLESNCFIWKYTSKVQVIEYFSKVKQQYDNDLEQLLEQSVDFIQGQQKLTVDENHLIFLLLSKWDELFLKANERAKEWIQGILQLFKKSLSVLLRRKKLLSRQLGVNAKYDPVAQYQTEHFDPKLASLLSALNSNKSYKISLYQGKESENIGDTLQCFSKDTELAYKSKKKLNLFNLIKELVTSTQNGEEFTNLKEEMLQFEAMRDGLKKENAKEEKNKSNHETDHVIEDNTTNQRDEYDNEIEVDKQKEQENKFRILLGVLMEDNNGSYQLKKKILTDLSSEVHTVDKKELKEFVKCERNNIVHQQSNYRQVRDEYIREKQIQDLQTKIDVELTKQMTIIQQNNFASTTAFSQQLQSIQMQLSSTIQQAQLQQQQQQNASLQQSQQQGNILKSIPATFKKQQEQQTKVLLQTQNQLQQVATNIQNTQINNHQIGSLAAITDKKQKKTRKVFLEIMKDKWEAKEQSKMRHMQKGGMTFGSFGEKNKGEEINKEKNDQDFVQKKQSRFEIEVLKVNQQQISSFSVSPQNIKNNFIIASAKGESIQEQLTRINNQNTAIDRFSKLHPNILSSDSPDNSKLLFQNSVKSIKFLNKFMKQFPSNEELNSPSNKQGKRSVSGSPSMKSKRCFQIRSISPQQQQQSHSLIKPQQKVNNWTSSTNIPPKSLKKIDLLQNIAERPQSAGVRDICSPSPKRRGGKEILVQNYQKIQKDLQDKMSNDTMNKKIKRNKKTKQFLQKKKECNDESSSSESSNRSIESDLQHQFQMDLNRYFKTKIFP